MTSAVRLRSAIGREAAVHARHQCGARLVGRRTALVADLLDVLPIEPFDAEVSVTYGRLRAELQRLGLSLAAMDLLIAAHALALDRSVLDLHQVFA